MNAKEQQRIEREILNLEERMLHMEKQMARVVSHLESEVGNLTKHINDFSNLLNGNEGIILRLDRLWEAEKRRVWMTRTVLVSVVGLLVTQVWLLLK